FRLPSLSRSSERARCLATVPRAKIGLPFTPIGFDVPPPVGAGGVTEAVTGRFLSPITNVRPSRRAVGAGGGSYHGDRSFPMANAGTVKFFNAERGYGF